LFVFFEDKMDALHNYSLRLQNKLQMYAAESGSHHFSHYEKTSEHSDSNPDGCKELLADFC